MGMLPTYDPMAALENCPRLMGLELRRVGKQMVGPYYITGEPHPTRRDKLKCFIWKRRVYVQEEGGDTMSLENWLVRYGGCDGWRDAIRVINSGEGQVDWSGYKWDRESDKKVLYVGRDVLEAAKRYDLGGCPLFRWFCGLWPEGKVREAFDKYNITTDGQGLAVFWYVDGNGRILHDKRVKYGEDGHRDKTFGGTRRYRTGDGYSGRCLFGAHLAPPEGKEFVVESEKTAVAIYLEYGRIGLATAGKNGLRECNPRYVCYPDKDAYDEWAATGNRCVRWWEKWGLAEAEQPRTADLLDMIEWKHRNYEKLQDK